MLCLQVQRKVKEFPAVLLTPIYPSLGIQVETLRSDKVLSYRQWTWLSSESSRFLHPCIYMLRECLPPQQTALGFQPTP